MSIAARSQTALRILAYARQIADRAEALGVTDLRPVERVVLHHLGAVLADSILQAGLNYKTVVRPRIERIVEYFPETATLVGIVELIEADAISDYLLWTDSRKIDRFVQLVRVLERHRLVDTFDLAEWLHVDACRDELLQITGVGPKTVDYLCCLVGIDCIAVDRHVKSFADDAGVRTAKYDELRLIVSYAADLLGLSRRSFDAWIWSISAKRYSGNRGCRSSLNSNADASNLASGVSHDFMHSEANS